MCAQVPSVSDIQSVVTVTLGDGASQNASGNDCVFSDAAKTTTVAFTLQTDPAALTSFANLGPDDGAVDLGNEDLPGAKTQLNSVLYALNDALYTVQVTSTAQSSEVSLQQATALLDLWVSD
ncbi:MAG: hypothetical protein JWL72_1333 [Ilumatobacteraceae bacterium]|nr:hypothetical protein [Ilumatobacteraceae bacterium]